MSSFTFAEAIDKLDCPHTSSCGVHDEKYGIVATRSPNELILEVSCWNCTGKDHFTFNAIPHRHSVECIEIGDTFVAESYIGEINASEGDTIQIMEIFDNPLMETEQILLSIITNPDEDPPYRGGTLSPKSFNFYKTDLVKKCR